MTSNKFRVESGIQMVLRLTRRIELNNFHPILFKTGPRQGDFIEMYSEDDVSYLLCDIICESMMPLELGGKESGVIMFNTDGKFNLDIMENMIKNKLTGHSCNQSSLNRFLQQILSNLFIFEIYDATQLYTTIQSLEGALMKHPNISLIIFDTLTAFFWSEQSFKITKMDMYLKKLQKMIQKATKDYKVVTLYTRPQYFSSSKEDIENLEACSEHPSLEHINYRLQVEFTENGIHRTTVRSYNELYKRSFKIHNDNIVWC